MKVWGTALVVSGVLTAAAHAADKPVIAPAPAWVKPVSLPDPPATSDGTAVRILLMDQQVSFEPGRTTVYSDAAFKIQAPQGLTAGNITFPWRPDVDAVTVHKLQIRRGDQIIDVLASGQTFTVVRREQNLESAMLDGVLTANIQPEGLQVGDVVEFAMSMTSSDPVLKGHVEDILAGWSAMPVQRAHVRLQWPAKLALRLQGLPGQALKPVSVGGMTTAEMLLDNPVPYVAPKGAPARYQIAPSIDATDFAGWSDLAALMAPLYDKAATLAAKGTLRDEIDRITAASPDPLARTQAALTLVQDRVRYVALEMGAGGYVPADADVTWSRRYGDCKGKTALLLALLHALGISAQPVMVSTVFGDGLQARLPMLALFNHVLVKAVVAGKTYWLDGTRTGDTDLSRLAVPMFGWGLPLIAKDAALIRMVPPPLDKPDSSVSIRIDATAGITIPAPTRIETILSGDAAIVTNANLAMLAPDARDRSLRDYWKSQYDFIDVKSASVSFDGKAGELHLLMEGLAKMDWSSGFYETDGTGVGYKADFSRDAGMDQTAPFAVSYPSYTKVAETIVLPRGFAGHDGVKDDTNRTVAGIEYHRRATMTGTVFAVEETERAVTPEFPAKEAAADQAALRDLASQTLYIAKPATYQPTEQELSATLAATPTTANGFVDRGNLLLNRNRFDEAIQDFDRALALDPKSVIALADRGIAHVWKNAYQPALQDLAAAERLDPRNAVVFRARGLMAQQKGDLSGAIAAYTTALEIEPHNTFALDRRATVNRQAGHAEEALRDAAASLKIDPAQVNMYLFRANVLRAQGRKEEALKEAAALETVNPGDGYAHVAAANLYSAFGKQAEALAAIDRALAVKPEPYIYLNRALMRPKTDVAGRAADLDAALKLDPLDADTLSAKGDLLMESNGSASAIALYAAALARAPDDPNILVARGIAYARSGAAALAEKDFVHARGKITGADAFNNMCWRKATAGVALESALVDCDAAVALAPADAAILDSRAFVLLRLGRLDDAIAQYDKALALSPGMASSMFGRAVAWARKGDAAKSASDAAAAVKDDPDVTSDYAKYGITLR